MRIALAQINLHVGNFEYNRGKILKAIRQARDQKADLVVFPELTVCGYPPLDLLYDEAFIDACMQNVELIAGECKGIGAIIGGPSRNRSAGGKSLFNSAFLLSEGDIHFVYHKGLLPTYDVFNEYRYFEPAKRFSTVNFAGKRIAITVCEDIWNIDQQGMYPVTPPDLLMKEHPELMINISASPFAWNHRPQRYQIIAENARMYNIPVFSVNLVGGQTDLLFDGASAVCNAQGKLVGALPAFREAFAVYEADGLERLPVIPQLPPPGDHEKIRLIYDGLVLGIRDYFAKTGVKQAILGLSGGIDSAVTLVLAVDALGAENVWAVLLPGPYSSDHSVTDAKVLAEKLGVTYDIISINEAVRSFENSLEPLFASTKPGIAEENIQARARAVMLMALSNKFGHMLLNTSNKSEAAVGYGTLYGDMCGGISVLGDVYKTEVYGLAKLINEHEEIIPENSITKPPSAELKPDQKDTDSLPDYALLDALLYCMLEKQEGTEEMIRAGFDKETVIRVKKMLHLSEYKRRQSPPILRVSPKCLGIGREMPLEAKNFL
ncbi:MAG: NAD+ synthase [Bacteroidales bacterium]|nr:NAD+ synthase [Bacteroidales bacterium]